MGRAAGGSGRQEYFGQRSDSLVSSTEAYLEVERVTGKRETWRVVKKEGIGEEGIQVREDGMTVFWGSVRVAGTSHVP